MFTYRFAPVPEALWWVVGGGGKVCCCLGIFLVGWFFFLPKTTAKHHTGNLTITWCILGSQRQAANEASCLPRRVNREIIWQRWQKSFYSNSHVCYPRQHKKPLLSHFEHNYPQFWGLFLVFSFKYVHCQICFGAQTASTQALGFILSSTWFASTAPAS